MEGGFARVMTLASETYNPLLVVPLELSQNVCFDKSTHEQGIYLRAQTALDFNDHDHDVIL
jgi:hypothetical protein